MDTFTAIETRRAVKHYDPEHKMADAEINKLMSLVLLAPTAFNIQNWRFVLVRDPELTQKDPRRFMGTIAGNRRVASGLYFVRISRRGKRMPGAIGKMLPRKHRITSFPQSGSIMKIAKMFNATKACVLAV